ncbi:hypothetical protein ACHWQZ_G005111 [Mnemiopsis leidyi]
MIVNDILEFYRDICGERVLILVSTTVDGLCAWKILQSLLHMDNVQYTLIPVDGKSHLESAFRTHSDQNTVIVLIDCGGNINVSEELEPLPDSQVYVLDSHIPYDLDNIYDGDVVKVVIPESFDLEVPRYEDIYEEDSENEDEPNRKRRREEEEEEEDSLLPRKERWKRKREELLFTYYELSGYNLSVSLMIFELAWKMSKDNSQYLWWAIIGVTDQYLNCKIGRDQYVTTCGTVQQHVQRLNNHSDSTSVNQMKIKFRIWTSKGKKKLNEFLADMGLPLLQCNQTFQSMDMEIRREVCGWIEVTAQKYGLDDISYGSFELQYGFKNKYCAGDVLQAVSAALTCPTLDTEAAFLRAQDTLNRSNEKLIHTGIEQSKALCCSLLNQVQAFIDMKQVVCTGPFVYAVIQEGVAELEVFAHPSRLLRLCRYLSEAYCATTRKAAVLPFIIASALPLDPEYSCIVGVPPLSVDSNKSYLGRAFHQAADKVNASVEFEDFEPSVMQIKSEDKAKFFDALTALLMT